MINCIYRGRKLDIFAEHFVNHMNSKDPYTRDVQCIFELFLLEVNSLNITKTLGTRNGSLYLKEKLHIVCRSRKSTGVDFLNRGSEIERACKHRTRFQGLWRKVDTMVSTDKHVYPLVSILIRKKSL